MATSESPPLPIGATFTTEIPGPRGKRRTITYTVTGYTEYRRRLHVLTSCDAQVARTSLSVATLRAYIAAGTIQVGRPS